MRLEALPLENPEAGLEELLGYPEVRPPLEYPAVRLEELPLGLPVPGAADPRGPPVVGPAGLAVAPPWPP